MKSLGVRLKIEDTGAMESKIRKKARAEAVVEELGRSYPDARCSLDFRNPFELLAATILSAQCTDERVNMVTPALFERFPTPEVMAVASLDDIEDLIRTTGFFRNKAKSLKGMAEQIVANHSGEVPRNMEDLHALPGVGRKTANVVLGNCFDTPGLTVDTHMQRVNSRLGLTKAETPEKIERDLMALIPEAQWTIYSHRIICHGRAICTARKPMCEICPLTEWCAYYTEFRKTGVKGFVGKAKGRGKKVLS